MTSLTPGRGSPVVIRRQGLPVALESAMNAVERRLVDRLGERGHVEAAGPRLRI